MTIPEGTATTTFDVPPLVDEPAPKAATWDEPAAPVVDAPSKLPKVGLVTTVGLAPNGLVLHDHF